MPRAKRHGRRSDDATPVAKLRRLEDDVFFERDADDASSSEEDETLEEKKLKIARQYLAKLGQTEEAETLGGVAPRRVEEEHQAVNVAAEVEISQTELRPADAFYPTSKSEPTQLAVTSDARRLYLVDKNGNVVVYDSETGARSKLAFERDFQKLSLAESGKAPWVSRTGSYGVSKRALVSAAVSDDQTLLAVGGGDRHVHVFDTRTYQHLHALAGHREAISGLTFQTGTHKLFSCSYDRTVKLWSLDDNGYVDTLYGHQSEILDIDMMHMEKLLTAGNDRSCRLWKTLNDTQLVFRSPSLTTDACRLLDGGAFVSGSPAGLHLWTTAKKKPVANVPTPHGVAQPRCWIQCLATTHGADLIASGAADGRVCLWQAVRDEEGRFAAVASLGAGLAASGFVTSVQLSPDGRVVFSAVSRRPRLGTWASVPSVRQGIAVHRL